MFAKIKTALGKIHRWLLKWPGLMGVPFYVAATSAAVAAKTAAPAAGLGGLAAGFYGGMAEKAVANLIPGTKIILAETFRLVTDVIAPGVGSVLAPVFHASAATGEFVDAAALAADISPGLR